MARRGPCRPAASAIDVALRSIARPPTTAPRSRGTSSARHARAVPGVRRPPLAPTSSRRPIRTPGRCRASRAAPKAALVEIQPDEYGGGDPRGHARHPVRRGDGRAGSRQPPTAPTSTGIPAVTLTTVNLVSLFGLHRRWRGALVGHLALFEMTSSSRSAATPTASPDGGRGPSASSTSTSSRTTSTRTSLQRRPRGRARRAGSAPGSPTCSGARRADRGGGALRPGTCSPRGTPGRAR